MKLPCPSSYLRSACFTYGGGDYVALGSEALTNDNRNELLKLFQFMTAAADRR